MKVKTRFPEDAEMSVLIDAARRHDEDAKLALIARCERRIVAGIEIAGVARKDADFGDAQNLALLEIWRDLSTLRNDSAVCAWMHSIARRVTASRVIDPAVRQRKRDERYRNHAPSDALTQRGHGEQVSERDLLGRVLGALTIEHREVLVLRFLEGLSEAETSELLEIPVRTVNSRVARAKKAAISALNELEAGHE